MRKYRIRKIFSINFSSYKDLAKSLLPKVLYEKLNKSAIAKRIARGSLWVFVGSAAYRLLVLLSMILVARVLGKIPFGELALVQATLGVMGLMAGTGLGNTATRFVSHYAVDEPGSAGRVIALITSVSIVSIIAAIIIIILTSGYIASSVLKAQHLQNALIFGSFLMGVTAYRGIQNGIFSGLEKFDLIAKINILEGMLNLIAIVSLSYLYGLEGAVLGLTLSSAASLIACQILLKKELKNRDINVCQKGSWAYKHILIDYSLPSLLANLLATPVLWFSMVLVANSVDGYAELGLYNAAYQWHGPIVFLPMVFMSVSIPVLVQEWQADRKGSFRKIASWMYILTLVVTLPVVLLVSILSPFIMSLYGPGYRDGWGLLILLLSAAPFHALAKISFGALLGMNKAWWVLGVNILWGLTMLITTVLLVSELGAMSLAIGFLVAHVILSFASIFLVFFGSRISSITR